VIAPWLGFAAAVMAQAGERRIAAAESVPFVGCEADGQHGPVAAPTAKPIPPVPAEVAPHLAYYASEHMVVLAPRGWHCFETYGSNGSNLFVAPEPLSFDRLADREHGLRGPAVQLSFSYGGTSGRFTVARLVARLFPEHLDFARSVAAEDLMDPLPAGPYPTDELRRRGPNLVEFVTPAGRHGLGTGSSLEAGDEPIEGIVNLYPLDDELDVTQLSVRLPSELRGLAPLIIASARPER
jgi:hypothetical protein